MTATHGSWQCTPTWSPSSSGEAAKLLHLPASHKTNPLLIIGRREWITLPDLGLATLMAKTDTGAKTSTLHAEEIHFAKESGIVEFLTRTHHGKPVHCSCPALQFKHVRNSGGIGHSRIFIRTTANFPGGLSIVADFTLANRSAMRHPVLLGRRILSGHFIVDPQHRNLLGTF